MSGCFEIHQNLHNGGLGIVLDFQTPRLIAPISSSIFLDGACGYQIASHPALPLAGSDFRPRVFSSERRATRDAILKVTELRILHHYPIFQTQAEEVDHHSYR
jgi:hypothetical protein